MQQQLTIGVTRVSLLIGLGLISTPLLLAHPQTDRDLVAPLQTTGNTDAAPMPFAGLAVQADPQIRLISQNQADYSFGRASILDVEQVQHTFILRNTGSSPLTIQELMPSCHCTSANVVRAKGCIAPAANGSLPTLSPGQQMAVMMTVHLPGHTPGPFSKAIFVYARGNEQPIARLQAVGDLETGLTMTPTVLDFGTLKPNEAQSRRLTVTYDVRLAPTGDLPPLVGGTNAITVAPIPDPAASTATTRTKTYMVTVRGSKPGAIITNLTFAPLPATTAKGTPPAQSIADALASAAVLVSGRISKN